MARFDFGFKTSGRNKFRGGLGGRSMHRGGTHGPRPGGGGFSFKAPRYGGVFNVNFTLNFAKSYFFDARDWSDIFEPAELNALRRAGALIRLAAQGQIRSRKKASEPGSSPTRWAPRGAYAALTNILYAVDPSSRSVIIGPIFISGTHSKVFTFPQPTIPATLEFGGSIRVGTATLTRQGVFLEKNRVVHIKARPYMEPALRRKKDRITDLFLDLLGRTPQCWSVANRIRPAA